VLLGKGLVEALDGITLRLTTPGTFGTFAERAGIVIERLTARLPYDSELPTTRIYLEGRAPA